MARPQFTAGLRRQQPAEVLPSDYRHGSIVPPILRAETSLACQAGLEMAQRLAIGDHEFTDPRLVVGLRSRVESQKRGVLRPHQRRRRPLEMGVGVLFRRQLARLQREIAHVRGGDVAGVPGQPPRQGQGHQQQDHPDPDQRPFPALVLGFYGRTFHLRVHARRVAAVPTAGKAKPHGDYLNFRMNSCGSTQPWVLAVNSAGVR